MDTTDQRHEAAVAAGSPWDDLAAHLRDLADLAERARDQDTDKLPIAEAAAIWRDTHKVVDEAARRVMTLAKACRRRTYVELLEPREDRPDHCGHPVRINDLAEMFGVSYQAVQRHVGTKNPQGPRKGKRART